MYECIECFKKWCDLFDSQPHFTVNPSISISLGHLVCYNNIGYLFGSIVNNIVPLCCFFLIIIGYIKIYLLFRTGMKKDECKENHYLWRTASNCVTKIKRAFTNKGIAQILSRVTSSASQPYEHFRQAISISSPFLQQRN